MVIQAGIPCKWTNDSKRLLLEHFDTICSSPSYIYYFAVPLCPPSSWLHKFYTAELLQVPKVVKGAKAEWGACSRTVSLNYSPQALSYCNNTIAVGSGGGNITIFDAITGSQMAVLSKHTRAVNCLTFSSDGKSLVSGSIDSTVKLWDVQTGGVVKTFQGDRNWFLSVSISADCTRIASGSYGGIHIWDIQTGECHWTIEQQDEVRHVSFSPTDPQHVISISENEVCQWDANGHQIPPTYNGSHIAFSPNHTQFALCNGNAITVQNSDSREILAKFTVSNETKYCCFSPDGQLIAAAAGSTAYVWDITSPDPHLVETFVGHTSKIISLAFSSPSSLISASDGGSVKFWQIGVSLTDPVANDSGPTSLISPPIMSVSLQAKAGIAMSSNEGGVVKTWDLSTGICKASFQTPAKYWTWRDVQLMDGRLIISWYQDGEISIWDINAGKLLQTVDMHLPNLRDLNGFKISGDGSKIFCLVGKSIQAWSMYTGEPVGEINAKSEQTLYLDPLCMDNSRIWIQFKDSSVQGWEFGNLGSPPISLSNTSTERPLLGFISGAEWQTEDSSWIKNTATGKKVLQLSGRYAKPGKVQWDGKYLIAGYTSGEVLIWDFHHLYPQ